MKVRLEHESTDRPADAPRDGARGGDARKENEAASEAAGGDGRTEEAAESEVVAAESDVVEEGAESEVITAGHCLLLRQHQEQLCSKVSPHQLPLRPKRK